MENHDADYSDKGEPQCFNGATAVRPWITHARGRRGRSTYRFNGATAVRPWKTRALSARLAGLQWGHGGDAVENELPGRCGIWTSLQWGHGGEAVENVSRDARRRSSMLQWGHGADAVENHATSAPTNGRASMGPRR